MNATLSWTSAGCRISVAGGLDAASAHALATMLACLPLPCFLQFQPGCELEAAALRELAAAVDRLDVVVLAAEPLRPLLRGAGFHLRDAPLQRNAPVQ